MAPLGYGARCQDLCHQCTAKDGEGMDEGKALFSGLISRHARELPALTCIAFSCSSVSSSSICTFTVLGTGEKKLIGNMTQGRGNWDDDDGIENSKAGEVEEER